MTAFIMLFLSSWHIWIKSRLWRQFWFPIYFPSTSQNIHLWPFICNQSSWLFIHSSFCSDFLKQFILICFVLICFGFFIKFVLICSDFIIKFVFVSFSATSRCTSLSCEHDCKSSLEGGVCTCPKGRKLSQDGRTCEGKKHRNIITSKCLSV